MSSTNRKFTETGLLWHIVEEAINREIEWLERAITLTPIRLMKVITHVPFRSFLIMNHYKASPVMFMHPINMLKRLAANTILRLGLVRIRQL